ncbi:MAG: hypothetical protein HOV83_30860, partial [Catenulispora sp.]|nr:hypothetical protein [Catenulispora sp.]
MNRHHRQPHADLRTLLELPAPILSVYLGHRNPADDDLPARRQAVIALLAALGATEQQTKIVEDVVAGAGRGRPATALFVGADGAHEQFDLPGSPVPDLVLRADVPHLAPLLAWRQARPAYVVAMLDRTGADLTIQPEHGGPATIRTVTGPDDEIERNAPGGWSQHRYQQRAEDSWQHNARRVAAEAVAALDRSGARILLLGGDVRAVQYFVEALPTRIRHGVTVAKIGGSRYADGGWPSRAHRIAEQLDRVVRGRTDELLAELSDRGGPGGPGGRGPDRPSAVIHALAQGRVR